MSEYTQSDVASVSRSVRAHERKNRRVSGFIRARQGLSKKTPKETNASATFPHGTRRRGGAVPRRTSTSGVRIVLSCPRGGFLPTRRRTSDSAEARARTRASGTRRCRSARSDRSCRGGDLPSAASLRNRGRFWYAPERSPASPASAPPASGSETWHSLVCVAVVRDTREANSGAAGRETRVSYFLSSQHCSKRLFRSPPNG